MYWSKCYVVSKRGVPCPRGVREPDMASKCGVTCPRGVREQVALPNVTSKWGVTCPHGVKEPGGVAGRGVKMWRHLPTWRQGARWRGRTWRQNVASLGDVGRQNVASFAHSVSQNVASLAHVASGRQVASQDVASKCGVTCLCCGVREPGGVVGRGVKMWRHLPTWRQGATCGRRSSASAHASGLT